jgi:hypothetical protein
MSMGLYRQAVHEILRRELRDHIALGPVVDAGGAGHKDEIEDVLGCGVETWDFVQAKDVDREVVLEECTGIPDAYAGTIICTSVLEHVMRPWLVAEQLARVCKDGGLLFVTAPWVFPVHKHPNDFWRFTLDGLGVLFGDGFEFVAGGAFVAIPREREGMWWLGKRRTR